MIREVSASGAFPPFPGVPNELGGISPQEYDALRRRVHGLSKLDLDKYNKPQLVRRLTALRRQLGITSLLDYADRLGRDPEEFQRFTSWFAINVSEFFRDRPRWDELGGWILPDLMAARRSLRIWSAGCSFGAEPYSLAMLLADFRRNGGDSILASDIDPDALARARAGGPYTAEDLRNLSLLHEERHFRRGGGNPATWWLRPESISPVTFQTLDLLRDDFPCDLDLILCRYVIIYFVNDAKSELFARFARSLRPGGILFIGGAETIPRANRFGLSRVGLGFYRLEPNVR